MKLLSKQPINPKKIANLIKLVKPSFYDIG